MASAGDRCRRLAAVLALLLGGLLLCAPHATGAGHPAAPPGSPAPHAAPAPPGSPAPSAPPAVRAASAPSAPHAAPAALASYVVPAAPAPYAVAGASGPRAPYLLVGGVGDGAGCHDSGDDRTARLPAVPPRSGSPLADLPHLSPAGRTMTHGCAAQTRTAALARAERGAPEPVGPTPVELAVLRV
ncbi:hypothetical protein C6N75_14795 [Streptomyces solincola]|uniref:Uncharacterized protein n=1 Tax=Streptomyces solincola TaxID=2100817 RepID=A0A2S9PVM8_9ACTN|nr:hypothetical protein [Streptomyces solincola]PRH78459.1 hypothetical protein C6N75_14795 [Streptomyces solincola]